MYICRDAAKSRRTVSRTCVACTVINLVWRCLLFPVASPPPRRSLLLTPLRALFDDLSAVSSSRWLASMAFLCGAIGALYGSCWLSAALRAPSAVGSHGTWQCVCCQLLFPETGVFSFCVQYDLHTFPQLLLFRNGHLMSRYRGRRTPEGLAAWFSLMMGKEGTAVDS